MKGRWMANEDYNIFLYVQENGAAGMKKISYWQLGNENDLWRSNKTAGSLRSRYRFYVRYLTLEDLPVIKNFIFANPPTIQIGYINFRSTTENYKTGPKKFLSVDANSKIILVTPLKRRKANKPKQKKNPKIVKFEEDFDLTPIKKVKTKP